MGFHCWPSDNVLYATIYSKRKRFYQLDVDVYLRFLQAISLFISCRRYSFDAHGTYNFFFLFFNINGLIDTPQTVY